MTIMQINKSIFNFVKFMSDKIESVNFNKQTKYLEHGLEIDDFTELKSFNRELCDIYSL